MASKGFDILELPQELSISYGEKRFSGARTYRRLNHASFSEIYGTSLIPRRVPSTLNLR